MRNLIWSYYCLLSLRCVTLYTRVCWVPDDLVSRYCRYSVLYNKSSYSRSLIGSYYDLLEGRRSEDVINTFFISQLYKTDRFLVSVRLFIIYYRRRHATCTTFILLLHISASSLITEQTHDNMEPIRLNWLFTDYSSIIGNDQWLINFEDAAKRKQEEREVRWGAAPPPPPSLPPFDHFTLD